LATFVGTLEARFGAGYAVLHLVLGALVRTRLANRRTQFTDGLGVFAVPRHRRCRQRTNCGTVHVQRDASRHHLDVLFLQTGRCTVIASYGAAIAGFDTGVEFQVIHY